MKIRHDATELLHDALIIIVHVKQLLNMVLKFTCIS